MAWPEEFRGYWVAADDWKADAWRVGDEIMAGFENGLSSTNWQPGDPLIACPRWNRKRDH
jgi:hypothetical protein